MIGGWLFAEFGDGGADGGMIALKKAADIGERVPFGEKAGHCYPAGTGDAWIAVAAEDVCGGGAE